jgi:exonuclease SbcC
VAMARVAEHAATETLGGLRAADTEITARLVEAEREVADADTRIADRLRDLGATSDDLAVPADAIAIARARVADVDRARDAANGARAEAEAALASAPAPPVDEERADVDALDAQLRDHDEAWLQVRGALRDDDAAREAVASLRPDIERQQGVVDLWASLAEVIGSSDGARFRTFAQGVTLESLLVHANTHLGALSDRYRLVRLAGHDLDFVVEDRASGSDRRGVNSLSGGETFLVSLALALGLASLSSRDLEIGSLFIDEGFGTLDPDTLDMVLSALDALQSGGRQVGVVSHVPGIAERIGWRVDVVPRGNGQSDVRAAAG